MTDARKALADRLASEPSYQITQHDISFLIIPALRSLHGTREEVVREVPKGWKLVPLDPTPEMVREAYRQQLDAIGAGFAQAYRTMLAAAPSAPALPPAPMPEREGMLRLPVAWRWRHVNSTFYPDDWHYQTHPIPQHNEYLQVEPLYAGAISRAADYTAWLIEITEGGPTYFHFEHDDDWTKDHDKAAHFSRKIDAERVIEHYGWNRAKAIEHMWPAALAPHDKTEG